MNLEMDKNIPNNNRMKHLAIIGVLAILLVATGIFFAARSNAPDEHRTITAAEARNLQKLSKVWGFTMYTHQTFLMGERCWDEELLTLIPIVRFADEDEVNDILYNWFTGLGDDGYDLDYPAFRSILLENFPDYHNKIIDFFEDADNHNWPSVQKLHNELWLIATGHEINLHPMANLSWINYDYLGESLAALLSRFNKIQINDRAMAPVYFVEGAGNSAFTNKERFVYIDYANSSYRFLGLFRLWNAVKYYFQYLDIIDYDWSSVLFEYIPKMLEGADQFSYELTLVTMASKLQDAHIHFLRGAVAMEAELLRQLPVEREIIEYLFGLYFAPVVLREAEGRLVVNNTDHGLKSGDIILRVNDIGIEEITEAMLLYLPYPNTDKALAYLVRNNIVLRQHSDAAPMAIDVDRLGEELRVYVNMTTQNPFQYIWHYTKIVSSQHVILENNIGLINPSMIAYEAFYRNAALHEIMEEFAEASINGLIIDLRQSSPFISYLLAEYLLSEQMHFVTISVPCWHVPGAFADISHGYAGYGFLEAYAEFSEAYVELDHISKLKVSSGSFFCSLNTVLLMNEHAQSHIEFTVMTLRGGTNVTVMGTNSIGANGNVSFLPLPGGIVMTFTGLGVYTPDGGQTQRIGLVPDIYVPRTIVGIRDGRDELMEAAVQFLRQ